jgi:hypothetical protein
MTNIANPHTPMAICLAIPDAHASSAKTYPSVCEIGHCGAVRADGQVHEQEYIPNIQAAF